MTAAIYARVSTRDKGQDAENQLLELRRYAAARGWEIVEYVDHESGSRSDREAFQRMFDDASRRKFGVVLVWALDRFSREGVAETFLHIQRLLKDGVQFESYTEAHFRTTGPAGELMLAIAAWIAKQERIRISERTKAGMARARAEGKHCGRPKAIFPRDRAQELRDQGWSWAKIGRELGVRESTLRMVLQPPRKKGGPESAAAAAGN